MYWVNRMTVYKHNNYTTKSAMFDQIVGHNFFPESDKGKWV